MAKKKNEIPFRIGQQVWLPNTGEVATITAIHQQGLIYVDAGGMNIPVFVSDISADLPESKPLQEEEEKHPAFSPFPTKVTDTGVYLLFIPEMLHDGHIIHYNCCIANDTGADIELQYEVYTADDVFEEGECMLGKGGNVRITHFNAETLNDIKEVELFLVPLQEKYEPFHIRQKISASSFMKKRKYSGLVKQEAFVYEILKAFKSNEVSIPQPLADSKKPFTFDVEVMKKMMTEKVTIKDREQVKHSIDIDLHAEAFLPDMTNMENGEILLSQIEHFNRALDRAIQSGQKIFYAIHGNGSGKLRMEIEKILKNSEYVASFNNSYHPRYGFGATEILLR